MIYHMLKVRKKKNKYIFIHLRVCFICAVYTLVIWVLLCCGCKPCLIYSAWACVPRGACVGGPENTLWDQFSISTLMWFQESSSDRQACTQAFYPRAISCLPDLCCCLCSFSSFKKYLFILSLALNPGPPMSASQLLSL